MVKFMQQQNANQFQQQFGQNLQRSLEFLLQQQRDRQQQAQQEQEAQQVLNLLQGDQQQPQGSAGQGQQGGAADQMMQTLQQLGVNVGQQQQPGLQQQLGVNAGPQRQQATLQDIIGGPTLAAHQPGYQAPIEAGPKQQGIQEYLQQRQQLPQMSQDQQALPEQAEQQPVLGPEQLQEIQTSIQNSPGQQLSDIQRQKQAIQYSPASARAKVQALKTLENREEKLQTQQERLDSRYDKYVNDVNSGFKNAQSTEETLDRLSELSDEIGPSQQIWEWFRRTGSSVLSRGGQALGGKKVLEQAGNVLSGGSVTGGAAAGLAGMLGLSFNLDWAQPSDVAEFESLKNSLFKGIRDMFGGRINQKEVEIFTEQLPSAMQRKDTRDRIINNLKIANQYQLQRKKVMDQILEANNGNIPRNLNTLVDRYTAPLQKQYVRNFKQLIGRLQKD